MVSFDCLLPAIWRGSFEIEELRVRCLAIALAAGYPFIGLLERRAIDRCSAMSWMFLTGAMLVPRDRSVARVRRAAARSRAWAFGPMAQAGGGAAS